VPVLAHDSLITFSKLVSAGALVAFAAPVTVLAAAGSPTLSGEISFELQNDWNYSSDDRNNLNNNLFTKIEPSVTFQVAPAWSVFAHAVLEPFGSAAKFENRAFEDIGLYLGDFYLEYAADRFGAKAGKLNPGFGVAWDKTPGVYGTDIAEDYEISERIGVIGSWQVGAGRYGDHTVSVSSFFADTTIFSERALRGRSDRRERDGGVSNTESFRSFVVALNGENIPAAGKLGYHLSYMRQAAGAGDAADENSVAAAVFTSLDLGGGMSFAPLFEVVRQTDQGGVSGRDRTYLTFGGQLGWKGWNLASSVTERETDNPAAENNTDTHFQVSAGYSFDFGLSIDIGWKVSEDAGAETRTLGALAAYTINF
jgi:hypothetical protein